MDLSIYKPPIKRCHLGSPQFELPDEILARILDLVGDPWLKLQCKGLSRQFYRVLGWKQCWNNSQMVKVRFLSSSSQQLLTINGRSFSMKKRWRALYELMTVIHTIRHLSYTHDVITQTENEFALLKDIFGRICRVEPTLLEFTFKCKTRSRYLPNLKPVFQFIRSCSPVLRSINIVLDIPIRHNLKRKKLDAIESMWSAIGTCNQLNHVFVAYGAYIPAHFTPLHPMSYHIRTALYSKRHLKSLELDVICWNPDDEDVHDEELFQLLQSLPLLEKLSLNMDPSDFADVLINHNLSIPVLKELTFTRVIGRHGEYETDSFCQALDMHLIPNLMSLSNGRCPFDPIPIIDRIFQNWYNPESHFLLHYDSYMCYSEFAELLDAAVTENDGSISAAPSTDLCRRKVYCLSSNNTKILFSVRRFLCCLCSDCPDLFTCM